MPQVTANVMFEADTLAEAEAIIAGWTLSPGCVVVAHMNAEVPGTPADTDESGAVVERKSPEVVSDE